MKVRGIRWVGLRTRWDGDMRAFAVDVLGLEVLQESEHMIELRAAEGDRFELYQPSAPTEPWEFDPNQAMVGFLVDDLAAACDELASASGVALLGERVTLDDGYGWQFFRAPDGNVHALVADPTA